MKTLLLTKVKDLPEERNLEKSQFYHATLIKLDGQPLFARGALPTIHTSLTYAVWYIYWMSRLDRSSRNPAFYIYELQQAERYLINQGNGLYSVSDLGSIPDDDRDEAVLGEAPELFRKNWDWGGKLTYVPAGCLQRLSAGTIKQQVDLDEWLKLCRNMDQKHPFRGIPPADLVSALQIPDFLRKKSS
jgi:hypothetical protein